MFFKKKKKHSIFAVSASSRRRKIKINWRAALKVGAVILVLSGLVYLLVFSPVFKIKVWSVESVNFSAEAQAQEMAGEYFGQKLFGVLPADRWLTFSSGSLRNRFLSEFPEAESVKIEKNILKGVKIIITGRQPAAIWCQDASVIASVETATTTVDIVLPLSDKCFFADSTGWLFREAPAISGTALPKFFSQTGQAFGLGSQAIASSTLQLAGQLKKELREIGIDALGFRAGAAGSQDLEVFADGDWLVYFNLERALPAQIKILNALLGGDLNVKRASLKYIDLRVPGKVYYK